MEHLSHAILVTIGLCLLLYGAFLVTKIKKHIKGSKYLMYWNGLLGLIVLFIIGYSVFIYGEIMSLMVIDNLIHNFIPFIFLFGAVFVVLTLKLLNLTLNELHTTDAALGYAKNAAQQMGKALQKKK